ncbi:hypothetical protein VitviT2T_026504 [Vitis vinifera]|uniref:Protein JINGUBANG n=2 Tax=Vitis vinifera TaxID=29760 RepID=A0ABY9DN80_VITVI|eukprot:XP_002276016.1 PREDICTED: vegetative incompatibility protein HET-E-1 [Vitis vinifera]
MEDPSLLATADSTLPEQILPTSDTSINSETPSTSTLSQETTSFTASLQSRSPESRNVVVSHLCVSSLRTLTPHISCLAVHEKFLYAASGEDIHVYDLTTHTHIDTFRNNKPTSGSVKSIAFHEGKIFTAHQDSKIRVWRITASKRHRLISTLPTVKDFLRRSILPKNYVRVRRHKKRLWIEHNDAVSGLAMAEGFMYSASWDKSFKIWRTSDLRCVESVKAHDDAVNAVAVSASGTVYTASADGCIRVWERTGEERTHTLITTLEKHKSTVNALALSGDGSSLFSGGCESWILVWEREESANHMAATQALVGHTGPVLCLITVNNMIISGSSDRTVRIWRPGVDGRYHCTLMLEGHVKPVKSLVAVSSGTSYDVVSICSGSLDGEIKVWEVSAAAFDAKS